MGELRRNRTMNQLARTSVLLALALVFQIGFNQFGPTIVGPLVNMTLLIAAAVVGSTSAILIGCLTPLMAFVLGISTFLPVVPFIMAANALLVLTFNLIRKRVKPYGNIVAMVLAAFVKFAFLAISIRYFVTLFVDAVKPPMVTLFTLPQLTSALIGGTLALLISHYLKTFIKE